jgi:hypothetical protein
MILSRERQGRIREAQLSRALARARSITLCRMTRPYLKDDTPFLNAALDSSTDNRLLNESEKSLSLRMTTSKFFTYFGNSTLEMIRVVVGIIVVRGGRRFHIVGGDSRIG